jgi:CcmD family protein
VIVAIGIAGATAWAQQQADGFVPVTGAPKESIAASPLVYAAYGFVWVALTGYVFLLWRRIGKVEQELGDLKKK